MAIRLKSNKDIKGFNIKLDEKSHTIKISVSRWYNHFPKF
jgi:hypothetical protein